MSSQFFGSIVSLDWDCSCCPRSTFVTPRAPAPAGRVKQVAVLGCAAVLLSLAGAIFWYQDLRYSLPTRKPAALVPVAQGEGVKLPEGRWVGSADGRALLLHFFNPHCPCSRFNVEHVRELRAQFGDRVRFIAVLQVEDGEDEAAASLPADVAHLARAAAKLSVKDRDELERFAEFLKTRSGGGD